MFVLSVNNKLFLQYVQSQALLKRCLLLYAALGALLASLGTLLAANGTLLAGLGPVLVALGQLLAALGQLLSRYWTLLGRSWGALGPSWAALGPLLGALGALLGRSWPVLGTTCKMHPKIQPKNDRFGFQKCSQMAPKSHPNTIQKRCKKRTTKVPK